MKLARAASETLLFFSATFTPTALNDNVDKCMVQCDSSGVPSVSAQSLAASKNKIHILAVHVLLII